MTQQYLDIRTDLSVLSSDTAIVQYLAAVSDKSFAA